MGRTKYNVNTDATGRTYDGIVFDSNLEMRYFKEVVQPKIHSGEIIKYELQKKYELQPQFTHNTKIIRPITYVSDFYLLYSDGHEEVIDTKGYPDNTALIKRKMFWFKYPNIQYTWVSWVKKYGGWIDYEKYNAMKRKEKKNKRKSND